MTGYALIPILSRPQRESARGCTARRIGTVAFTRFGPGKHEIDPLAAALRANEPLGPIADRSLGTWRATCSAGSGSTQCR